MLFSSQSPYRPVLIVAGYQSVRAFSREQRVLDRGGADVPGRQRVVDQRGVAPPAVRVGVQVRPRCRNSRPRPRRSATMSASAALKNCRRPAAASRSKWPSARDRVDDRQAVAPGRPPGRPRRTPAPGAPGRCRPRPSRSRPARRSGRPGCRRGRTAASRSTCSSAVPGDPVEDLRALAEGSGDQRLGDDEQLLGAGRSRDHVGDGGVDRDGGVADSASTGVVVQTSSATPRSASGPLVIGNRT